jgi:hypothetical protein
MLLKDYQTYWLVASLVFADGEVSENVHSNNQPVVPSYITLYNKSAKIFQKSKSHLEILGFRRVTCKFHTEDSQILDVTV